MGVCPTPVLTVSEAIFRRYYGSCQLVSGFPAMGLGLQGPCRPWATKVQ